MKLDVTIEAEGREELMFLLGKVAMAILDEEDGEEVTPNGTYEFSIEEKEE